LTFAAGRGIASDAMKRLLWLVALGAIAVEPSAWADDHADATALVTQLEQDGAHRAATGDAVARAKDALERAQRMRAAGDEAHAKAADGLALEWAQAGRDLAKAVDAEQSAAELRRKAVDAQAKLERSRALVEEALASVGRLQAELDHEQATPHEPRVAVETHDGEPAKNDPKKKDAPKKKGTPAAPKPSPGSTP
jgi:hypothetical protein